MKKIVRRLGIFSAMLVFAASVIACGSTESVDDTTQTEEPQSVSSTAETPASDSSSATAPAPAKKGDGREEVLDVAQRLADSGDYDGAVKTLDQHTTEIKNAQADIRKKQAAAKAAAERDAKIAQARKYIDEGKYDQAVSTLNGVVRADPNDQEAKDLLAEARQKQAEEKAKAERDAKIAQARRYIDQGKYDEAISLLNGLLRADPYDSEAQDLLEEAQQKKALAEGERERAAKKAQAARLIAQGKYDDAIVLLEEVLAEDPYDSEAQEMLDQAKQKKAEEFAKVRNATLAQARKLIDDGKYDEAIDILNGVLDIDPYDYEAQDMLDEATAKKAAIEAEKERVSKIALAKQLIDEGKYDEAIEVLDELVKKNY